MNNSEFHYGKNFYGSIVLNPTTLANIAASQRLWKELLSFHKLLATDEYVEYLDHFYREGIKRFKNNWYYMDIINVLYAASITIKPENYLEIGVRRGRSVCTVARGCPNVNIIAFEMWQKNYAGMENPGPDFVRNELKKNKHTGKITFIDGNSHVTVPEFFKQNQDMRFDLITVDGDHSEEGAYKDLCDVIPHLATGGVIVFDDIVHPMHLYLLSVWRRVLDKFPYLSSFEYIESGYGVAFAIRRSE